MQASEKLTLGPARPRPAAVREASARAGEGLLPQHAAALEELAPHPRVRAERQRRRARRVLDRGAAGRACVEHLGDDRQHDPRRRTHGLLRPRRGASRVRHEDVDRAARRSSAVSSPATTGDRRCRSCSGISATIERFKQAMDAAHAAESRSRLPDVVVDPSRVQASGLVKDTVVLDIPGEPATSARRSSPRRRSGARSRALRWKRYAVQEKSAETVVPLLVLQTPNTPDPDEVGRALDAIHDVIPDLTGDSVRHVLSEQQHRDVRPLGGRLDRAAAGTGADRRASPRREGGDLDRLGLPTGRGAREFPAGERSDAHHPAPRADGSQPARAARPRQRPPERGRLHPSVLRPHDRRERRQVHDRPDRRAARSATSRVLLDGRELEPNPEIGEDVWAAFDALPTQTVPQRGSSRSSGSSRSRRRCPPTGSDRALSPRRRRSSTAGSTGTRRARSRRVRRGGEGDLGRAHPDAHRQDRTGRRDVHDASRSPPTTARSAPASTRRSACSAPTSLRATSTTSLETRRRRRRRSARGVRARVRACDGQAAAREDRPRRRRARRRLVRRAPRRDPRA